MVDLLYLAWNRREFTEFTFSMLLKNTDWSQVSQLIVYDDGSEDGTREYLDEAIRDCPAPYHLRYLGLRSPVAVMKDYLAGSDAEVFAKVDNDLVVPPGWLNEMIGVMERQPEIDLLGMESPFMGPPPLDWDGVYRFTPWRHIGGNGLMRTKFFHDHPPMDVDGLHGFTGFQWRYEPVRGWITPDLPVCLLDRCPIEPWRSLADEYIEKGWQRPWRAMGENYDFYWKWFTEEVPA